MSNPYDGPAIYEQYKPKQILMKLLCRICGAPIVVLSGGQGVLFGCAHEEQNMPKLELMILRREITAAEKEIRRENEVWKQTSMELERVLYDYQHPHEDPFVKFFKSLQEIFRFVVRMIASVPAWVGTQKSKIGGGGFSSEYLRSREETQRKKIDRQAYKDHFSRRNKPRVREGDLNRKNNPQNQLEKIFTYMISIAQYLAIVYLILIILTSIK